MKIDVVKQDVLEFEGDALVLPTTSSCQMNEGLAARVKAIAGERVEEEVLKSAPVAVGAAVGTRPGRLNVNRIIHVPVIEQNGLKIPIENIRRATRAGLLASTHFQLEKIAIPGFGYGEFGVPHDEAARAILDEIRAYRTTYPSYIALIDMDHDMLEAFVNEIEDA